MNEEHKFQLQEQMEITARLKLEIERMVKENKDVREEIENKAWNEIDAIKEKNKEELLKITQIGMNSKADLQLINSKFSPLKPRRQVPGLQKEKGREGARHPRKGRPINAVATDYSVHETGDRWSEK